MLYVVSTDTHELLSLPQVLRLPPWAYLFFDFCMGAYSKEGLKVFLEVGQI